MPIVGRPESPQSVVQFPTMSVPRRYWSVDHALFEIIIVNLSDTRNQMYTKYQQYKMSPRTWYHIDAFLDELRFATEPNLRRWSQVPTPNCTDEETYPAEEWMYHFGVREDIIDLTVMIDTDDEDDEEENTLLTQ